jgi:hypothetical protein
VSLPLEKTWLSFGKAGCGITEYFIGIPEEVSLYYFKEGIMKVFIVDPLKCSGGKCCELACFFEKTGKFNII